jgi:hypothetical protein
LATSKETHVAETDVHMEIPLSARIVLKIQKQKTKTKTKNKKLQVLHSNQSFLLAILTSTLLHILVKKHCKDAWVFMMQLI